MGTWKIHGTIYNEAEVDVSYTGTAKLRGTLEIVEGLAKAHIASLVSLHRELKMHISHKFLKWCWCCRDHNLITDIKGIREG